MTRHLLRISFVLLLLFGGLQSIKAQINAQITEYRNNLAVGFNGGVTFNNITFSPNVKQSFHQGIVGGFTARYISEKYFSMICGLQVECNFSQRGWKEKIEDGTRNTYQRTLNYVELPFLAHLAFGADNRGTRFFINAGPQFAFFMNDKEERGGQEPWDPSHRPNNVIYQYGKAVENKLDYGITGGLGVELLTGIGHFLFEGRYYYGLSDIYGNSKKDDFSRSGLSTIYGKVTYLFDLTK
ncbi:MAG: PorT family protein [Bacteroidaceae bacterium]|nr:PorT family protein [Bacteroidaceae bacterium]